MSAHEIGIKSAIGDLELAPELEPELGTPTSTWAAQKFPL